MIAVMIIHDHDDNDDDDDDDYDDDDKAPFDSQYSTISLGDIQ